MLESAVLSTLTKVLLCSLFFAFGREKVEKFRVSFVINSVMFYYTNRAEMSNY